MKNFSGRENFGGEMTVGFWSKNHLRHTDGVRRGNVRSMMNGREMILGSDGKQGGIQEPRLELEIMVAGGTESL